MLDVCHTGINVCTNESGWCYGSGFAPVSFSVSRFSVVKIFTVEMYIYAFRDCGMRRRCVVRRCMDVMVGRDGVGYDVRQWLALWATG